MPEQTPVVLLTGGGSGIGLKVTQKLLREENVKIAVLTLVATPELSALEKEFGPTRLITVIGDITNVCLPIDFAGEIADFPLGLNRLSRRLRNNQEVWLRKPSDLLRRDHDPRRANRDNHPLQLQTSLRNQLLLRYFHRAKGAAVPQQSTIANQTNHRHHILRRGCQCAIPRLGSLLL